VTEQLEDVASTWLSVQVPPPLKLPAAVPAFAKLTDPCGNDFVPESVSETVAVHVEPWLIATDAGAQLIDVEVERLFTVSAKPALSELFACVLPLAV
jgi:hypothetical protein